MHYFFYNLHLSLYITYGPSKFKDFLGFVLAVIGSKSWTLAFLGLYLTKSTR